MTTTTDPLTAHRAVLQATGPQGLAQLVRPLTADEDRLVDAWLAKAPTDPDAFAGYAGLPHAEAAQLRALLEDSQR